MLVHNTARRKKNSMFCQMFWHLGQKSAENLEASKCFLGCDEFNTLVEDKVKWSKADWHCTPCARQLISWKDQYSREVSKQRWRRQMFTSEDFFFPNTDHLALQENKSESRAATFPPLNIYRGSSSVLSKDLKVVLHYALPHAVVAKCIQIIKYWLQLAVAECEGWHNSRFEGV